MTSSTDLDESEIRVSKRPCIFEKSPPLIFVIRSIASCAVTITQTFPPQRVPSSSTKVCRFNISDERSLIYCPTSSTMKISRKFLPLEST